MNKKSLLKYFLVTGAVLLFGIFDSINMFKIPSIYETLCSTLAIEPMQASWLMTSYSTVALILAIPAGWLSRKLGYIKLLIVGIAMSLIGSLIGALSFTIGTCNVELLIFSRMLEGTCYIFSSVCIPVVIQRIVKDEHIGKIMGIWAIRVPIACFIGEALTPILVETFNLAITWTIFCILVLITSIIMLLAIMKWSDQSGAEDKASGTTARSKFASKSAIKNFVLFLISFVAISVIQAGILNYAPTILQMRFDMSGSLSGILTSLTMIISIGSSLLFGYFCDKHKTYKYVYLIGCALMGPGAFLMFTCYGPLFILGQVLLGIGLGAPAVSANAVFEILEPRHHSIGIGIGMAAFSLGQVLGSSLTQLILNNTFENYYACAFCFLLTGILGTILSFFSRGKKNERKSKKS